MLLSSSATANNFRSAVTSMDDFTDQDWFEESTEDEVVKHHQQQSPLQIPLENGYGYQPAGGSGHGHNGPSCDFLELNVPVDENVFNFDGSITEMSSVPQYVEEAPRLLELDNNHSHSSAQLQAVQQHQSVEEHQHSHDAGPVGFMGSTDGSSCFYPDCPPTTSGYPMMNTLDSLPHQKQHDHHQSWTTLQTSQRFNDESQHHHFLDENDVPMARIIVRDQSMTMSCAPPPHPSEQHFGSTFEFHRPLIDYSAPCSSNMLHGQNASGDHFVITDQQQHNHPLRIEPSADEQFHHSSRVPPFQFRQQTPPQSMSKTASKKGSKSRQTGNNNGQKTISAGLISQTAQKSNSVNATTTTTTNLDQIANMLFSNSNLATVQFDPQQASEFGQLLEATKELKEQEEQGIDVSAQLKACEDRVAEFLMRSTMQSQNATPQQFGAGLTNGTAKKPPAKSKSKKKKPPTAQPINAEVAGTSSQTLRVEEKLTPAHQRMESPAIVVSTINIPASSTLVSQPAVMLMAPPNILSHPLAAGNNIIGVDKVEPRKQNCRYASSSQPPTLLFTPSSSSTAQQIIVHKSDTPTKSHSCNTKDSNKSALKTAPKVQIVDSTHNKNNQIQSQQSIQQLEREREEECEKAREKRRICLSNAFNALRSSIPTLDYNSPFADRTDCVKRLLPFGLFSEAELSEDILTHYDSELKRHSDLMCTRLTAAQNRFRSIFLRNAMCDFNEDKNLLLYLDTEFERSQLQKDAEEKASSSSDCCPVAAAPSLPFCGTGELPWDYNDNWDHKRYLDIAPFTPSPPNSPDKSEELEAKCDIGEKEAEFTDINDETIPLESSEEQRSLDVSFTVLQQKVATIRVQLKPYAAAQKSLTTGRRYASSTQFEHLNELKPNELITVPEISSPHNLSISSNKPNKPIIVESILKTEFSGSNKPENSSSTTNAGSQTIVVDIDESLVASSIAKMMDSESTTAIGNGTEQKAKEIVAERKKELTEHVKLKITFGKNAPIGSTNNRSESNLKEEKMKEETVGISKLEKKRLKAEKKARKKQAKLDRERMKEEQKQTTSYAEQNEEKPPSLKISLRRLACWRGASCSKDPDPILYQSKTGNPQLSNGVIHAPTSEEARIGNNGDGGDGLKLRISKLILKGTNSREVVENGTSGAKNDGRKRSRKRKEESNSQSGTIGEEGGSPLKVPKLKIRIGSGGVTNELMAHSSGMEQKSPVIKEINSKGEVPNSINSALNQPQLAQIDNEFPPAEMTKQCDTSFSKSAVSSNNNNLKRVQFSPCCSEESDDDELRHRTNEIFSKLIREQR